MKYDIVALGEILVDLSQHGVSEKGNPLYEASPGGAPGNMLTMASRLGSRCAFIGKIGDDLFGDMLREKLNAQGIDCRGLVTDRRFATTLAFVHQTPVAEKRFSFCRKPGADAMLEIGDIDGTMLQSATIFHFGTISSTHDAGREATRHALTAAMRAGCLISFDPNIRHGMWESPGRLAKAVEDGCRCCQILKVSDEELAEITAAASAEEGVRLLSSRYPNIQLFLVTMGSRGCYIRGADYAFSSAAHDFGAVRDTTGAGDSFLGCVNHFLARNPEGRFEEAYVRKAVRYASVASSLIVTRVGSLCEMPTRAEIEERL